MLKEPSSHHLINEQQERRGYPPETGSGDSPLKRVWQFFCSLPLSIYLGLLICALLWVGSYYFLFWGNELAALNEEALFPWLYQRGGQGLVSNWWLWLVLLVLALLAFNTFVCSIERLKSLLPRLFQPKLETNPRWMANLAIKEELTLNAPLNEVKRTLHRALIMKKFRCRQPAQDKILFARRGRFAPLAPYLVHLGFLLVLIGHFITSGWGQKSFGHRLDLGEKHFLPHSSLWVRLEGVDPCSKEETDNYCSELSLGKGGEILLSEEKIGVNQPLLYQGLALYQADWGQQAKWIELTLTQGGISRQINLAPGERKDIAPGIAVEAYGLLPDFAFSPQGEPVSRSRAYKNPALLLVILKDGVPVREAWLFLYKPSHQRLNYEGIEIKFSGLATSSYLIMTIARNPGATTVLIGGILFILASAWVLLGNYRRLWFYLEEKTEGVQILCGGTASQKRTRLQAELTAICNTLKSQLQESGK